MRAQKPKASEPGEAVGSPAPRPDWQGRYAKSTPKVRRQKGPIAIRFSKAVACAPTAPRAKPNAADSSLPDTKLSEPPPELVEVIGTGRSFGRWEGLAQRDPRHWHRRLQLTGVLIIGRPATGSAGDKCLHPRGLAGEGGIGLEPGHQQGRTAPTAAEPGLPPVQTGLLEFPGVAVDAERRVRHHVQMPADEVEHLLIPKPAGGLRMDL